MYSLREPRDRIVLATAAILLTGYGLRTLLANGSSHPFPGAVHAISGARPVYLSEVQATAADVLITLLALLALVIAVSAAQMAWTWWRRMNAR